MEDNNTLTEHSVNDAEFWQKRYDDGYTGWDIGKISPPLQAYIEHLLDNGVSKSVQILIPGRATPTKQAIFMNKVLAMFMWWILLGCLWIILPSAIPVFPKRTCYKRIFWLRPCAVSV